MDEDIFATDDVASDRVKELSKEGLNKFFIRRLKEDMKDWDGHPLYKTVLQRPFPTNLHLKRNTFTTK